jgi:molecular chaperone DnaJ
MFSDLFEGMGGMGGQRGGRGRGGVARGFDLETEVQISLEEVLAGCERDVEFDRLDVCDTCTGNGAKPGSKPTKCGTCGGQGRVQQSGMGGMFRMVVACPECRGSGQIIKEYCPSCRGRGRVPKRRKLAVKIPPGIQDGQAIRVQGEGEPPPPEVSPKGDGVRGDLHVGVRIKQHEVFKREGDHLVVEVPVTFTQATLGAEINIPSLDGAKKLTLPRGTQHGTLLRIAGAGLPNLRSGRRGDLAVITRIEVPKKLNSKQEDLLREYAKTEDEKLLPETHSFWKRVKGWLGT